jgi:hypothetical protein
MDHCERRIILYATKLLEISLNFIDANCEKIKIRRGLQCLRERVLLHFREAKNTGGEKRVHGRGNGVQRHVGVRIGLPDRRDVVPGKIGWSTSRGAVP